MTEPRTENEVQSPPRFDFRRASQSEPKQIVVPKDDAPRACLGCGTFGGRQGINDLQPVRCQGLCARCYAESRPVVVDSLAAAPCVDCGTIGGYRKPREKAPLRSGGRCSKCDWAARKAFTPDSVPAPAPTVSAPSRRYFGPLGWLARAFDARDFRAVYGDGEHEEEGVA